MAEDERYRALNDLVRPLLEEIGRLRADAPKGLNENDRLVAEVRELAVDLLIRAEADGERGCLLCEQ